MASPAYNPFSSTAQRQRTGTQGQTFAAASQPVANEALHVSSTPLWTLSLITLGTLFLAAVAQAAFLVFLSACMMWITFVLGIAALATDRKKSGGVFAANIGWVVFIFGTILIFTVVFS